MLETIPEPRTSATVILLRDNSGPLEVLMLQKNSTINYGGSWVFPGGVTDAEDHHLTDSSSSELADIQVAKVTAVRETFEEAGIHLSPEALLPFAHWTTPKLKIKRYATWFFMSNANELSQDIAIDDGEIVNARWVSPSQALHDHTQGGFMLNGPSYVTLTELTEFSGAVTALESYQQRGAIRYQPRGVKTSTGLVTLYSDDKHYSTEGSISETMLEQQGHLHRLYMPKDGLWQYVQPSKPARHT